MVTLLSNENSDLTAFLEKIEIKPLWQMTEKVEVSEVIVKEIIFFSEKNKHFVSMKRYIQSCGIVVELDERVKRKFHNAKK